MMTEAQQRIYFASTPEDLSKVADELLKEAGNESVWAFYGEMGTGKTTLIKALCNALGITENVSSPTFSIVNEYYSPQSKTTVYHFDFYRIKSEREAQDIGCEEYFYSGNFCFVEWPSNVCGLLPDHLVEVHIEEQNNSVRQIQLIKK